MAWQVAGYAVAAAVLVAAAAIAIVCASAAKAIRRLDRSAVAVSREAEHSLRRCAELADEAGEAIALSKRGLEGFASLAEGARAVGEAGRTVADAAIRVTELYRERLSAPLRYGDCDGEDRDRSGTDAQELGRRLWSAWLGRFSERRAASSERRRSPGTDADATEGAE